MLDICKALLTTHNSYVGFHEMQSYLTYDLYFKVKSKVKKSYEISILSSAIFLT